MADTVERKRLGKRTFEMAFCETGEPKDVFVAIVKSMKTEDICSYFEKYGEIESVGLTVRFKDNIDANTVLQRRHHKIGKYIVKAETPREMPNTNDCKRIASPRKHILDFDDKSLKKIGECLSDDQLIKMSETCVRFKGISSQVFAMKHKGHFKIDLRKTSIAEVEPILKAFGATIDTLTLTSELHYKYYDSEADYKTEMTVALKLASDYCGQMLRELHINDDEHMDWPDFSVNFPKLERLYWHVQSDYESEYERNCCECPNLAKFITPLPSLKELTCTGYMRLTPDTLSKIIENWPSIEKFCYSDDYECEQFDDEIVTTFSDLKSLKRLKCIDIYCSDGIDLLALINGLWEESVPIESLVLNHTYFDDDEVINGLSKLKNIRTLKMNRLEATNEDLVNLAKSLPLLEELKVSLSDECKSPIDGLKEMLRDANKLTQLNLDTWPWQSGINTADYQSLANLVKRRKEKRKLTIVSCNIELSHIDAETIERNKEWLEISKY